MVEVQIVFPKSPWYTNCTLQKILAKKTTTGTKLPKAQTKLC